MGVTEKIEVLRSLSASLLASPSLRPSLPRSSFADSPGAEENIGKKSKFIGSSAMALEGRAAVGSRSEQSSHILDSGFQTQIIKIDGGV